MAAITSAVVVAGSAAYSANKQAKAAKSAARTQAQAAREAGELQEGQYQGLRSDLAPYREAGQTALPLLQEFATDPTAQVEALQQNPLFQAALQSRDRATLGAAARQGRIGTGDFSQQLSQNYLLAASPLLQQQKQDLLNLASIGQSSAAQTGAAGMRAGESIGQTIMGAADAQSAGIIAQQQAENERNKALLEGFTTVAQSFGK